MIDHYWKTEDSGGNYSERNELRFIPVKEVPGVFRTILPLNGESGGSQAERDDYKRVTLYGEGFLLFNLNKSADRCRTTKDIDNYKGVRGGKSAVRRPPRMCKTPTQLVSRLMSDLTYFGVLRPDVTPFTEK